MSCHALLLGMRATFLGLLALVFGLEPCPARADEPQGASITVFAAASLKNALDEASAAFTAATGTALKISYASSAALARQIEQAAPADVFISADLDWMDYLAEKGLIAAETRSNLLGNALVLISPADSAVELKIGPGFALAGALGNGRLAIADTASVPAGRYAKSALQSLGVWASVEGKLAQADNVRAALAFVAQKEAPLGIVYKTDASAEPKVRIVGAFPPETHPPIVYPAAMIRTAGAPEAALALLSFLKSDAGHAIFARHGFTSTQ